MSNTTHTYLAHPGHQLLELKSDMEYVCHACKSYGEGTRVRCNICNFDWHEYCVECPKSILSFMHPHNLSLVLNTSITRKCSICTENIEGNFYCCGGCEFDVHPICSKLPQHLRHVLHPDDVLTLQQSSNTACNCCVCGEDCISNSWRYRCGLCVPSCDIHLQCVLEPCDMVTRTRQLGPIPPRHDWPHQPHHGVGYYFGLVPSYTPNPYNNSNYQAYQAYQAPVYNNTHAAFEYNMASPNYMHQVPTHNMYSHQGAAGHYNMFPVYANNSQVPTHDMYSNQAAAGHYNIYTGYAYNSQVPAPNYVTNIESPGFNGTSISNLGVPTGSNPSSSTIDGNQAPKPGRGGRIMKKVFKIVGIVGINMLSSVVFGVAFPGLT